ncbi:MAG TPA: GNAT family N-acetyltransferase [Rhodanobacteraceae bacterium]|nr:GNAT family N-acetyltransferase [Rhodanobacteraceae bacterium]
MALAAPTPLAPHHDCSTFDCGNAELSGWLRRHARNNEAIRGSRCFVACDGNSVAGFYALAAGSVERRNVRGSIRRNMPEPVPAVLLGRLAVDRLWQGRGLGADLLQDATLRALRAAQEIGARVLLCHAIDARAHHFYLRHGFAESTFDTLTVMLDLRKAEAMLQA